MPMSGDVELALVTAGDPNCTPPVRNCAMYVFQAAAADWGSIWDPPYSDNSSGSLNPRTYFDPAAMAALALATKLFCCPPRPQSIGTYSTDSERPPEDEPQLYPHETAVVEANGAQREAVL